MNITEENNGRIKPVGPQILVKITKPKSSLHLLPDSHLKADQEVCATIVETGTNCSLGLQPGHQIIAKPNTAPLVVEENEEYCLVILQETQVAYIKNWINDK